MKFQLRTSGTFYSESNKKALEGLGFVFESDYNFPEEPFRKQYLDKVPEIEIITLEELIAFTDEWGGCVIDNATIEIYDNYRE